MHKKKPVHAAPGVRQGFREAGEKGKERLRLLDEFREISKNPKDPLKGASFFHGWLRDQGEKFYSVLPEALHDQNTDVRHLAALCIQELPKKRAEGFVLSVLGNFDLGSKQASNKDAFLLLTMAEKAFKDGMHSAVPLLPKIFNLDLEDKRAEPYTKKAVLEAKIDAARLVQKLCNEENSKNGAARLEQKLSVAENAKELSQSMVRQLSYHTGRWEALFHTGQAGAPFMKQEASLIGELSKALFEMEYGGRIKARDKGVFAALDGFAWLLHPDRKTEYFELVNSFASSERSMRPADYEKDHRALLSEIREIIRDLKKKN